MKMLPVRKRWLILIYLALLAASQFARRSADRPPAQPDGYRVAQLSSAFLAYRDEGDGPAVLLIPGSPAGSFDLGGLADRLSERHRVLLPDLPGFGRSQRFIRDYSFRAHADALLEWLDQLGIARVHVAAYSQGGGVALWLAHRAPDRVASLAMVSAVGVQEMELLGNYELNHSLHAAQWSFFAALAEGTPHFGFFDRLLLNKFYARNFLDSDQRPLRGFLEAYAGPMLILHAEDDVLVPPAAAIEHHRIVPQSELQWIEGGHVSALFDPERVAPHLEDFFDRVERGEVPTRDRADAERLARAAAPPGRRSVEALGGFALVMVMTLIVIATFVSEDLACIGAGLMAAHGTISYAAAALAAFVGIFFGDILLFLAGKYLGRPAMRRRPFRWFLNDDDIEESARWFDERGPFVIVLSRFVPGSRLPTYFVAGLLHTQLWKFLLYFLVAGVLWAPLLVWLAMTLGGGLMEWLHAHKTLTIVTALLVALLLWLVFEIFIPMFSFKGRRLLLSAWRRKTRWEFWPPWIFYPPIVAYVGWLGLKHRGLGVFSACNPAMPTGGLIGESKSRILEGLKPAGDAVARGSLVRSAEEAISFLREARLGFPIVLKPDVGQRGLGVAIAKSEAEVRAYFEKPRGPTLAQEFVPGYEFGVFYARRPGAERGFIFSITEKRFPDVIGDGRQDLEHLILSDDRAVCIAPMLLRKHRRRLREVPAPGEHVALVELGTHCRGSLFRDGMWAHTRELEEEIDRISRTFDGFYFGRYDIRVRSIEDFRAGRNVKIIELNGVSSEATAIYDPGHSLMHAYRMLCRQWRLAFEIGAANRARGARPDSAWTLLRALVDYQPAPEA